ncbi:hypothetical protein HGG75_27190 [Ochrobactrum pseudogrignonense]|nr:hypothetical protein [Brucella pseudogrignonensis]
MSPKAADIGCSYGFISSAEILLVLALGVGIVTFALETTIIENGPVLHYLPPSVLLAIVAVSVRVAYRAEVIASK